MTSPGGVDPFGVLGVAADSPPETIRRAYRKLVVRCHPDRNPSPEAAARFLEVTEAYRVIRERAGSPTPALRAAGGPRNSPEPPILSWKNVEQNFHFCLRGIGRVVRRLSGEGHPKP